MPRTRVAYSLKSTSATVGATSKHKKSVGSQFRDSLNALMATLNATTPHYIRCIKPNDNKQAFEYNVRRAVQQLRACGVLETIRISAAGFPSRWLYIDFFNRYRVLCHSKYINRDNMRLTCESIIIDVIKDNDKYKFGKTKIFFRAGQVAYLERLRSEKLKHCCLLIQKTIRGFLQRRRYVKIQKSVQLLQRYSRGLLARRLATDIRRNRSAIKIQKHVRCWLKRNQFKNLKALILGIQTRVRGLLARRRYNEMRYNHAATIINKHVRGWLCRRSYQRQLKNVVICQNSIRRYLARKVLKKLKIEARSVEKVKQLNKGLENKIINLQQRIEELLKENASLKKLPQEINDLNGKLEVLRVVESQYKKQSTILSKTESKLEELIEELQKERGEKMDLLNEKEKIQAEFENLERKWINENNILRMEVTSLQEENKNNKVKAEKYLQSKLEEEKMLLLNECNEDKVAYQKLVAEKNNLETQCDYMAQEINRLKHPGHNRSMSDDSSSIVSGGTEEPTSDEGIIGSLLLLRQRNKCLKNEHSRLKIENSKLKDNLDSLRKFVVENISTNKRTNKDNSSNERKIGFKNTATADLSLINEDGELALAFEAQKQINRQLEEEIKTCWQKKNQELLAENSRLVEDIESYLKLQSNNLAKAPHDQTDEFLRSEIAKVVHENVRLQEENDMLQKRIQNEKPKISYQNEIVPYNNYDVKISEPQLAPTIAPSTKNDHLNNPVVRKKEANITYMGMFEFRKEDESDIIKNLVYDLKPSVAINLLPGLPAYILFMCIRYTDFVNDEDQVSKLLTNFVNMVKKITRKRCNDLDSMVLWFSNALRLLNNLKQYSGDKSYNKYNTPTQNEQCLRNFDLSEYRVLISGTAVWMYQGIIRCAEERVTPYIIPAILEHEAISSITGGMRPRATSLSEAPTSAHKLVDGLIQELDTFYRTLKCHDVDQEIIVQFFQQIFYFICACCMNNLLLRKDLCRWSKGMQIRYNLSHLEQRLKDYKLKQTEILDTLAPIIQASQLLQARKSDEDVDTICTMCSKMTPDQIIKILKIYIPDDFEDRVTVSFLKKITIQLKERKEPREKYVMMDTKHLFPVNFVFKPSNICLEDIEIPEVLNLPMLKKV